MAGGHRDYSSVKKGSIGQPGGGLFAQQGDPQRLVTNPPVSKPAKTLFVQGGDRQPVGPAGQSPSNPSVTTMFPQQGDPRTAILGPNKGKTVLGL